MRIKYLEKPVRFSDEIHYTIYFDIDITHKELEELKSKDISSYNNILKMLRSMQN